MIHELLNTASNLLKFSSGHSEDDEYFFYEASPHEFKRNIDMDLKAKRAVSKMKQSSAPTQIPTFPSQRIILLLSQIPIVCDLQSQLQNHQYGHSLEKLLLKTLPKTTGYLYSIDWQGLEAASSSIPLPTKISRMKIVYHFLPKKSLLCQRRQDISSRCLRF